MSTTTQCTERPAATMTRNSRGSTVQESHHSSARPAGKGRRRRAAAEQRRLELQQLGALSEHLDHDFPLGSNSPSETVSHSYEGPRPPGSRRQQRKATRRALAAAEAAATREEIEDYFSFTRRRGVQAEHSQSLPGSSRRGWGYGAGPYSSASEQEDLELAFAVSLSLSESGDDHTARTIHRTLQGDLSYENLVNLEDVPLTLPKSDLQSLPVRKIGAGEADVVCPICLGELVEGDSAVSLPCCHAFHQNCGSEWLLHYSRCCPVCKQEVGEKGDDRGECSD